MPSKPLFERRHYIEIAQWVKYYPGSKTQQVKLAHFLKSQLHSTNERFDPTRFLNACGLDI